MSPRSPDETLADLRVEIDRIDLAMHRALIERGHIIERLIAAKARQGGGSAFRPGREAAMMRALAERHEGPLPLDTVESIWRIVISTFTFVQANYAVHADTSGGDPAMRDTARFHFGFSVPFVAHHGAGGVVDAVTDAANDLGLLRVEGTSGAWWQALVEPGAPKVIARLPFVERPNHPAGMPVFVISRPLADAAAREVVLHALTLERWHGGLPGAIGALGGEVIASAAVAAGLSVLVALPGIVTTARLREDLHYAGVPFLASAEAGSHAARYGLAKAATDRR